MWILQRNCVIIHIIAKTSRSFFFKEIFFFVNSWISLWAQSFNSFKEDLCQDIKGVSHLVGVLIEKKILWRNCSVKILVD